MIDTCERYCDESKQKKSRKVKSVETVIKEAGEECTKQHQTFEDKSNGNVCSKACSPVRRKRGIVEETSGDSKRFKMEDVTDSIVAPDFYKTGNFLILS